ncbi:phosphate ABC transporter substrate-binding protein [Pokkaliibacter plantistimulans]|uniref:Phosphate-binding protein PstS n=1 Tax=Pokkaliibacter plantistimulans TaxID=1635171 RepID=A0ABX5LUL0_9GAMM|nr:phosphate ABC transporter substrate-binding protein PstS [Pokkaliibacter plantistimulans]PXF28858.1 phosphate ABC transporter substrate-binding protein [Pokkaliibacter plantistimulans]
MNKLLNGLLLASTVVIAPMSYAKVDTINGAGATFPYPVYAKWAEAYNKAEGVKLNYQSIGSGGGIKQIKAKTVDFGASDAPLTKEELDQAGLAQFPAVMGAIVPVINVKGIEAGQLKLSGQLLADIYSGKVKMWDDAAIASLNEGVKLPHMPIYTVHRSDGSGTTFNFTDYLARVSPEWQKNVGVGKEVAWPKEAQQLGGKGNEGVANFVSRTPGSIGYVEFAYAKSNNLTYTQMENKAGKFVKPEMAAFQAAAANADWSNAPGFHLILNDQPGDASWPMTAATFILVYKQQDDAEKGDAVLKFFDWSFANGDQAAEALDYIPMPDSVVKMIEDMWRNDVKDTQGMAVYK